jgi:muramidase (phage lysozyme)/murein DD-endopeptidase MepM/ murein hydrolase activator NlpD
MLSANARALLDTIAKAEGTAGGNGYRTMFTGRSFNDLSRHPRQLNSSNGHTSDAAGRYQFLSTTWDGVAKRLGLPDFSPASQDRAAIELVRRRGVDPDAPLTEEALNKLAPEWASLPTLAGKSYYGQPVKPHGELLDYYSQRLGAQSGGAGAAPSAPGAFPSAEDWSPQGADPLRLAGQALEGSTLPRNQANPLAEVALAAVGSGWRSRFAGSPAYRQDLAGAVQPMEGIRQRALGDGGYGELMDAATAALTPAPAGAAPQPSMATAGGGGMPAITGGGPIGVGRIADPSEDVFPTTGAHLDVRILTPDGQYIDPMTAPDTLQHLRIGGKPLFAQQNGSWLPTRTLTSGFGPRRAPTAGASTMHRGADFAADSRTPLEWTGGGQYSFEGGIGRIRLADGRTVKLLHTRPS